MTLKNGATLIDTDGKVVLARSNSGCQPFVTWALFTQDMDTEGMSPAQVACKAPTGWGHYFDNIEEATADYAARKRRGY